MRARKTFIRLALSLFVVATALVSIHPAVVQALKPSEIEAWTVEENSLPATRTEMGTAEYNGYIYLVGGAGAADSNSTVYAQIQENGSVGEWQTSANVLPFGNFRLSAVAHDGYLYAIGGRDGGALDMIYRAQLNSETGAPGAWTLEANELPVGLYYHTSFVYEDHLYVVGGDDHSGPVASVYIAPIEEDHTIGTWEQAENDLPVEIALGTAVVLNDYAYMIGGRDDVGALDTVYYAALSAGEIGNWVLMDEALPDPAWGAAAIVMGNDIFAIGGNTGSTRLDTVSMATITAPGETTGWVSQAELPVITELSGAVTYDGNAYVLGGVGTGFLSGVYSTIPEQEFLYGDIGDWDEQPIDGATIEISCGTGWQLLATSADGEYSVSSIDIDEAMGTLGCNEGDLLQIRASADDYETVTVTLDDATDYGDGDRTTYLLALLSTDGEQNFTLDFWESAGTQIIFPEGDESKTILLEQQEDTEICSEFDEDLFTRTEAQLDTQDDAYDYTSHLVGFTMTGCEVGGTTTMRLIFTGDFDPDTTVVRKYDEQTQEFATIEGATKTATTLDDLPALEITYEITDGGELDQDGEANGTIVDPVGLGVQAVAQSEDSSQGGLADTGQPAALYLVVGAVLIGGGALAVMARKRTL